jgi:hypothetical protein
MSSTSEHHVSQQIHRRHHIQKYSVSDEVMVSVYRYVSMYTYLAECPVLASSVVGFSDASGTISSVPTTPLQIEHVISSRGLPHSIVV